MPIDGQNNQNLSGSPTQAPATPLSPHPALGPHPTRLPQPWAHKVLGPGQDAPGMEPAGQPGRNGPLPNGLDKCTKYLGLQRLQRQKSTCCRVEVELPFCRDVSEPERNGISSENLARNRNSGPEWQIIRSGTVRTGTLRSAAQNGTERCVVIRCNFVATSSQSRRNFVAQIPAICIYTSSTKFPDQGLATRAWPKGRARALGPWPRALPLRATRP